MSDHVRPDCPWNPEQVSILTNLWTTTKLSASQIAIKVGGGATRNSVMGKVRRLNLPNRLPGKGLIEWHESMFGPPRPTRYQRQAMQRLVKIAKESEWVPQIAVKPVFAAPIRQAQAPQIFSRAKTCQWPTTNCRPWKFCDAMIEDGHRSYCENHRK